MAQVLDLDRRVDARKRIERIGRAVGTRDRHRDRSARLERRQPRDADGLGAVELQRAAVDALGELQR